jgi:hypothetical protein
MLTDDNTELADPEWSHHWRQGGPITGEQVVPSHWRELAQSGPMRLAGDTRRIPTRASPSRRALGDFPLRGISWAGRRGHRAIPWA